MQKHEAFIKHMLFNSQLPPKVEPLKALFLYCCISTLQLLKSQYDYQRIIEYLKLLEVQPHQYKASTFDDSEPSIVNSYCAIAILTQLQCPINIDQQSCIEFVQSLITPDGNIKSSMNSEDADLRMVYSAIAYLDMLNIKHEQLFAKMGKFILTCQNPDGAFGLRPNLESHSGASFCAIASLKMLKITIPNKSRLLEWLMNRQCNLTGGIAGRINKLPDSCYSFWVGWSLKLLDTQCELNKISLQEFVKHCESPFGGFSKYPDGQPDPIHTLHSLLGTIDYQYDYVHGII